MTATLDDHPIHSWLTDMDGVLVHEEAALPGAAEFISALQQFGRPFLVLTNNSIFTPRDLRARLSRSGIDIPEDSIWTSALATARLLAEQQPGAAALPGAADFIPALQQFGRPSPVLTNSSLRPPRHRRARRSRSGIDIPEESIWTSALATARFLAEQQPGAAAYVIGEAGLTSAMHDEGFILADSDVEFVVLGETRTYSFEAITRAIRLITGGAKFIATNPDVTGPSAEGPLPATGSVAAMITAATGIRPYYIG